MEIKLCLDNGQKAPNSTIVGHDGSDTWPHGINLIMPDYKPNKLHIKIYLDGLVLDCSIFIVSALKIL